MESMIDKLFDLHMSTEALPLGRLDKEQTDREWELYFTLTEKLSKSDSSLFAEYLVLRQAREEVEKKNIYAYGFKAAIQLFIESLKE